MIRVYLKPDKDKPLRSFHPWVFSGAIDRLDDGFKAGDLVNVFSDKEEFLGIGYLNPRSQIAIRMLTFKDETIDQQFFVSRFQAAEKLRQEFVPEKTNAYRLIHSEGDFLPGLIVDRYSEYLVVQFLTAGMEVLKPIILDAIRMTFPAKGVYEHSDEKMRGLEGLDTEASHALPLRTLSGEEPPDYVEIQENGHSFLVDLKQGQKTGFFLDQRENRRLVTGHVNGKRVLNCFAYTGAFSIYAVGGGAVSVTSVESQERALNTARTNFELNHMPLEPHRFICEDVFNFLRTDSQIYDVIILDPPAFCKNKNQVQQAARGYKDINLQAFKRLSSGGFLFTSSCSSHIEPELFQKIVFGAAKDAQRNVQIVSKTSHAFDHPINIYHPEGEYLKSLFLRAL